MTELIDDTDRAMIESGDRIGADLQRALLRFYDEHRAAIPAAEAGLSERAQGEMSLVEQAFRDGVAYGTICEVTDVDLAWETSAIRAACQTGPSLEGLSEWDGWDQERLPWSESNHKDEVLQALFRAPWSMEDAEALIGFIDRTWPFRALASRAATTPAVDSGDIGHG